MKIKWEQNEDRTWTGRDENGNRFEAPANMETCMCTLPDGRKSIGWTPEEAVDSASNQ
jgi:hypothetical protein